MIKEKKKDREEDNSFRSPRGSLASSKPPAKATAMEDLDISAASYHLLSYQERETTFPHRTQASVLDNQTPVSCSEDWQPCPQCCLVDNPLNLEIKARCEPEVTSFAQSGRKDFSRCLRKQDCAYIKR